jgi:hypothetical protein
MEIENKKIEAVSFMFGFFIIFYPLHCFVFNTLLMSLIYAIIGFSITILLLRGIK